MPHVYMNCVIGRSNLLVYVLNKHDTVSKKVKYKGGTLKMYGYFFTYCMHVIMSFFNFFIPMQK